MADEKISELQTASELVQHPPDWHDWHSRQTIVFDQLLYDGFDWGKKAYGAMYPDYTDEMRTRINQLIESTYMLREICDVPSRFKAYMIKNLNLALGNWLIPYKMLWEQKANLLDDSYLNSRNRQITSNYPASQLSGNEDYATDANDSVYGETRTGAPLDKILQILSEYESVENKIVQSVDKCFLSLMPAYYKDGGFDRW